MDSTKPLRFAATIGIMAGLMFFAASTASVDAEPGVNDGTPGEVGTIAFDLFPAGNPSPGVPGLLGPVDACRFVTVGQVLTIDVVLDEVAPGDFISGVGVEFFYDPDVISFVGVDVPPGLDDLSTHLVFTEDEYILLALSLSGPEVMFGAGEYTFFRVTLEIAGSGTNVFSVIDGSAGSLSGPEILVNNVTGATLSTDPTVCPNTDADFDGIIDADDICPEEADPGQENSDGDGLGDACDVCPDDPWPSNGGCPFPPSIGGTTTLIVTRDQDLDGSPPLSTLGLVSAAVLAAGLGTQRLRP
ncbi:MAG: hypothetical protein WD904_08960 [Dehalococcoidia bacterium]